MFTILIPDRALNGSLENFQILLEPFLQGGETAICPWEEDLAQESAFLSRITELTRGKRYWRAMIVTDSPLAHQENPFDFEAAGYSDPAAIPLVHLTHLLGQMPRDLAEMHSSFNPPLPPQARPAELLLCSTRYLREYASEEKLEQALTRMGQPHIPSQFWQRNGYAWQCRFLTVDVEYRRESIMPWDLLKFWLTVLTLACNEINPSVLHAFCLYRIELKMDEEKFVQTLGKKCSEFSYLQQALLLRQQAARNKPPSEELPVLAAPIQIMQPESSADALYISPSIAGYFSDSPFQNGSSWYRTSQNVEEELEAQCRIPRYSLEDAVEQARLRGSASDLPPLILTDRRKQDLRAELLEHEAAMQKSCSSSKALKKRWKEEVETAQKQVQRLLDRRMSRKCAIIAVLIAIGAYFVGMLTYFAASLHFKGEFWPALGIALLGTLPILAAGGISLWHRHKPIREQIRKFNETVLSVRNRAQDHTQHIAHFLTETSAVLRGWNIFRRLGTRTDEEERSDTLTREHLYALRHTASCYQNWANLAGKSVQDYLEPISFVSFDRNLPPESNPAYWLEADAEPRSLLAGGKMHMPYRFLLELRFEAEEVTEDALD
ncbi:MAG: hypothetical protein ACOX6P_08920 [Candidatus Merdivicinus sp.]|jgi:hypothetical protein